jgi:hypothetical protein
LFTFFAEEESQVVARRIRPLEGGGFDRQAVTGAAGAAGLPVGEGVDPVAGVNFRITVFVNLDKFSEKMFSSQTNVINLLHNLRTPNKKIEFIELTPTKHRQSTDTK